MGGDHAPAEVVRGSVSFVRSSRPEAAGVTLQLIGDPEAIRSCLRKLEADADVRLVVVAATQVVGMDEHPLEAVRKKPDSSIAVCAKRVKSGEAHATVSAGNTGACLVAAVMIIERLSQISRPPIACVLPTQNGIPILLVDGGANVDCQPSHLADFALLGSLYSERVFGIPRPRVALLSNGEEEGKGDELVKRTRPLLQALPINFIGSIEGNHFAEDRADVIVCDGFAGNVLLKTAEGMGALALSVIEKAVKNSTEPVECAALEKVLADVRRRVDYAEYGGAPLLGLNGVSVIAHGRSDARAIESAIGMASRAARSGYVSAVKLALEGSVAG